MVMMDRLVASFAHVSALIVTASLSVPAAAQDTPAGEVRAERPSDETPAETSTEEAAVSQEAEATAFVQRLLDDAEAALTEEDTSDAARLSAFQNVLRDGLALEALSKFIISRGAYDAMSDEQRARYDRAFPDYITQQYAEQFDGVLGNPLEITETKPFRKDIFVRTRFVRSDGPPLNVDWRTRAFSNESRKLIDIVVNGASIMSVKRSEFAAFIEANGVDALLTEIEKALPDTVAVGATAGAETADAAAADEETDPEAPASDSDDGDG